jgi:DNA-binding MarR family transcriptional regulator
MGARRAWRSQDPARIQDGVATFRGPLLPARRSGPIPAALEEWAGFSLIVSAHAIEERYASAMRELGISLRDFVLLAEIAKLQGLPQGTLAHRVGLTPARVSEQLLVLDKAGYVERQIHELDLRKRRITLSWAGQHKLEEAKVAIARAERGFLSTLHRTERILFCAALRRLPAT